MDNLFYPRNFVTVALSSRLHDSEGMTTTKTIRLRRLWFKIIILPLKSTIKLASKTTNETNTKIGVEHDSDTNTGLLTCTKNAWTGKSHRTVALGTTTRHNIQNKRSMAAVCQAHDRRAAYGMGKRRLRTSIMRCTLWYWYT